MYFAVNYLHLLCGTVELLYRRFKWLSPEPESDLLWRLAAFPQVVRLAAGNNVTPRRYTTFAAWNNMIECQFLRIKSISAVLTGELIPQKQMVSRKCSLLTLSIPFQRDNGRHLERTSSGTNANVVIGFDLYDPVLVHGHDGILPSPDR